MKAPPRKRMTTDERDAFYAEACGENDFPICPFCLQWVKSDWEVGHVGTPHALGGIDVSVWHTRCNRLHGATVVTPLVAKVKRQYKKHRDIYRSRNPFRTKEKPMMRKMDGTVVDRVTGEPWKR